MVCPKCGREGLESGDAFCRHCGFSLVTPAPAPKRTAGVAEKKPVTMVDSDASKGLRIFGGLIFVLTALLAPAVVVLVGLPSFAASVLPWLTVAFMMVGLVMMFIGFKLRPARQRRQAAGGMSQLAGVGQARTPRGFEI